MDELRKNVIAHLLHVIFYHNTCKTNWILISLAFYRCLWERGTANLVSCQPITHWMNQVRCLKIAGKLLFDTVHYKHLKHNCSLWRHFRCLESTQGTADFFCVMGAARQKNLRTLTVNQSLWGKITPSATPLLLWPETNGTVAWKLK